MTRPGVELWNSLYGVTLLKEHITELVMLLWPTTFLIVPLVVVFCNTILWIIFLLYRILSVPVQVVERDNSMWSEKLLFLKPGSINPTVMYNVSIQFLSKGTPLCTVPFVHLCLTVPLQPLPHQLPPVSLFYVHLFRSIIIIFLSCIYLLCTRLYIYQREFNIYLLLYIPV